MHLKKVIKKENKFFIEHYIIVDAIDGSTTTKTRIIMSKEMK